MRLEFQLKSAAQAKCNAIHAWMIANNAVYAQSVAAGRTTAWAKPYQDLDRTTGLPLNAFWYVNLRQRCRPALSAAEIQAIKPYRIG